MKLQRIFTILGILVFIAFTPVVSLVFNSMSVLGMSVGIAIALFGLFMPKIITFFKKHRVLRAIVCIFLILSLLWALVCSLFLVISAVRTPDSAGTVIVLGCQIKGERPSKMLRQRLDKAYDYLTQNPEAVAIMSGGQGPDEIMPEAVAMKNYLTEKGIDPDRIYTEPDSHNTQQNMEYSAKIIKEEGLDTDVAVITQSFHQYRASVYASEVGLKAYAINCKTNPGTLPTYWLREMFAVVKMYLVLAGT
ncbi:MAG: YdcF family protein [Clostridia bacterium]|nr:YdcF family protein [Clostridia bacterium]